MLLGFGRVAPRNAAKRANECEPGLERRIKLRGTRQTCNGRRITRQRTSDRQLISGSLGGARNTLRRSLRSDDGFASTGELQHLRAPPRQLRNHLSARSNSNKSNDLCLGANARRSCGILAVNDIDDNTVAVDQRQLQGIQAVKGRKPQHRQLERGTGHRRASSRKAPTLTQRHSLYLAAPTPPPCPIALCPLPLHLRLCTPATKPR